MVDRARPHVAHWLFVLPTRSASRLLSLLFGWLLLGTGLLPAQFLSPEQLNPLKTHQDGLQLYGVSAFTNYLSAVPGYLTGTSSSSYEIGGGVGANAGWNWIRPRTSLVMQYSFLFENQTGGYGYRTFSHRFTLSANHRLGYRWNLAFSGDTQILNSADLIFMQGALTQALDVPGTFQDLTSAVLAGRFTANNDIAAILTRSYAYTGPAQSLVFGDRLLTAVGQVQASYRYSPRLVFHFDGSASRTQTFRTQADQDSASRNYLVPQFTMVSAQTGLSYSLSPRTTIGMEFSAQRGGTSVESAYTTTAMGSIGRVMGRRWFLGLRGGASVITPVQTTYPVLRGPQSVMGGTLGFKTLTHTLAFSADRSVIDTYGIGPSYTLNTTGTWSWRRPGRSWSLLGSFGQQRISSAVYPQIITLQGTATFVRRLTRGTMMTVSYAYLHIADGPVLASYAPTSHGIRVTFRWTPGGVAQ